MAAITLLPYQEKCFLDRSRFKVLMWARGARKTFTVTLEIVDECFQIESQGKRTTWVIVSRGERQALEAMREIKRHCQVYNMVASEIEERDVWSDQETKAFKVYEVTLPMGSRIIALSANPDSLAGYTANVYLDEFALHKDSRAVWSVIYPVLRGRLRMIVSSTPRGKGNKFYEIITGGGNIWSSHVVDIYDAVRQGLPFDIDLEREAMCDPDAWAQEYELRWLDEASSWLGYDLIAQAEVEFLVTSDRSIFHKHLDKLEGDFYIGWDIARRRDLSIMWVVRFINGMVETVEVVNISRRKFEEQLGEFDRLMNFYNPRRACLDQTGMGEVIVEICQKKWGESRVEGVLFNNAVKQDMATVLKRKFEDRQIKIPTDREIRDSLHSIKKMTTTAGNVRFDAERTEVGHGDYFWAAALAVHGGSNPACKIEFIPVGRASFGSRLGDYVGGGYG